MVSLIPFIIPEKKGDREVYISPIMLHSKELNKIKADKIEKLYVYSDLKDENYRGNALTDSLSLSEPENWIIHDGQNFEDYYLGQCDIDFDKKSYSNWRGKSEDFTERNLEVVANWLFNIQREPRKVILFTPTRASEFNLIRKKS